MIKLYNSLSKKKEEFKPIKKGEVKMYTCGPTVYNYAHIGNLRTMILYDLLKRTFLFNSYKVRHVMNITDVDDKTIRGSKKENLALRKFTEKYERIFLSDIKSLNIIPPETLARATENIDRMVDMIQILIKKGYAYKGDDGIYFSISKDKNYGKLVDLKKSKKKKERIKSDEYDKENAQDFALWKFHSEEDGEVYWETSIGKGRPGWHIECSAMATKILGPTIDLHSGAIDLLFPHHTNEIAQSECCTGKKFVNYWVHGAFLYMGEKMSKSLGNVVYLNTLKEKGYSPKHFRYFCLLSNYRKSINFSYENLDSAKIAYEKIKRKVIEIKSQSHKGIDKSEYYLAQFQKSINDDLNMPLAVQVFLKALDDFDFDPIIKLSLLNKFDSVLGLGVDEMNEEKIEIPKEVIEMLDERNKLRSEKRWAEADIIRERIKEKGFNIIDDPKGPRLEVRRA